MLFDQQTAGQCRQLGGDIVVAGNQNDPHQFAAKSDELMQLLANGMAPLHHARAESGQLLANMRQNQLWELNGGVFADKDDRIAELRLK